MKRRVAVSTLAAALVAVVGLGTASGAKTPKKVSVDAVDYSFVDETVKVRKGGKVTWYFVEGRHNVTGKGWKSSTKTSGKYSHEFDKVGTYKYRCTLHQPDMDGVVKVVKR